MIGLGIVSLKCILSNIWGVQVQAVQPFKNVTSTVAFYQTKTLSQRPLTKCALMFLINLTGQPILKCRTLALWGGVFNEFYWSLVSVGWMIWIWKWNGSQGSSFCMFWWCTSMMGCEGERAPFPMYCPRWWRWHCCCLLPQRGPKEHCWERCCNLLAALALGCPTGPVACIVEQGLWIYNCKSILPLWSLGLNSKHFSVTWWHQAHH